MILTFTFILKKQTTDIAINEKVNKKIKLHGRKKSPYMKINTRLCKNPLLQGTNQDCLSPTPPSYVAIIADIVFISDITFGL